MLISEPCAPRQADSVFTQTTLLFGGNSFCYFSAILVRIVFCCFYLPCWLAQLFLSTYCFRPHLSASGESGIRIRNFLNPRPRVEIFEYAINPESCGSKMRICIFIFFFIPWCNKIEPSSLSWKVEQDTKFARFMTHFLLPIFPGSPGWKIESRCVSDTCGRANSISTRIRACGRGYFWIRKEKYPDTCGRGLGERSVVLSLSQNYINLPGFPCWMQTEKGP